MAPRTRNSTKRKCDENNNPKASKKAAAETPPTHQSVLFPSRESVFTDTTWWMVDLQANPMPSQGATPLVNRCMKVYNWSEEKARGVLKGYRQFLKLKQHCQDWDATKLSPPTDIDLMWHQHILDVGNYIHDCLLLCGHVVLHKPDGAFDGGRPERLRFTRECLRECFPEHECQDSVWDEVRAVAQDVNSVSPPRAEDERVHNEAGEAPDAIWLRLQDQIKRVLFVKMKQTDEMRKIYSVFAVHTGMEPHQLRFLCKGVMITHEDTPQSLGLVNGDQIDVMFEQSGC